ncbi:MAG: GTPase Era [Actinomycetota bacterium]|nr:GTPase Era [Actinomycetota bacterium]
MSEAKRSFRAGFVAVVGRPNVGKSTLVNALVGQKVAIVSDKPQTTRHGIRGVLTTENFQLVLTDTPGFHKPRTQLGHRLNRTVAVSVEGVDVVLQVVDAASGVGRGDRFVHERQVAPFQGPKLCAVNKVDAIGHRDAVPQLAAAAELGEFDEIVPISARTGQGVDELRDLLVARLPESEPLFPPGEATDQPIELRVAEIVREKALELTREEVPHSIAVEVEEMEGEGDLTRIEAIVLVERDSQKGIVIGRGGQMLKAIGSRARPELELLLGTKVFLGLRVKVLKEWQRDPRALDRLGF